MSQWQAIMSDSGGTFGVLSTQNNALNERCDLSGMLKMINCNCPYKGFWSLS